MGRSNKAANPKTIKKGKKEQTSRYKRLAKRGEAKSGEKGEKK